MYDMYYMYVYVLTHLGGGGRRQSHSGKHRLISILRNYSANNSLLFSR